ncbi:DUF6910 family protein [Actinoplanes sp. NPDC051513]|uniref:DUF6910 family protein n=1 Tax=Actinoplanes sp. NPDC051513 TaxID=3363908 RepID=UPI0037B22493
MKVVVESASALSFADGSPVRAASAIVSFGGGWLVVQDDATHAAWVRPSGITPVRVVEAVDGLDVFSEAAGTKHLKPDFEAACAIGGAALLLGSGSSPARMRGSLVRLDAGGNPAFTVADLAPVYRRVAAAMGLADQLNLEGACVVGDRLRWFQRANRAAGAPTVSVDVDLEALLATFAGGERKVAVGNVRHYDLGDVDGVALGVTDAVAAGDGLVLVSAVAEDTSNAIDDGPVAGAALMLLDDEGVRDVGVLNAKVEGLAFAGTTLLAVVDADDPAAPSLQLTLRVAY